MYEITTRYCFLLYRTSRSHLFKRESLSSYRSNYIIVNMSDINSPNISIIKEPSHAIIHDDGDSDHDDEYSIKNSNTNVIKATKKKVAMILGYKGTNYQGMQVNPNAVTVESVLYKALCEAGFISSWNASDQKKVSFQRACRTDKGVHAAMQLISLKLLLTSPHPDMIMMINTKLPKDIRVFGIQRVTNTFQAKTQCDSRIYEYLLPTWILRELEKDGEFWNLMKKEKPTQDLLLVDTKGGTTPRKRKGHHNEDSEAELDPEEGSNSSPGYIAKVPTEEELREQSSFKLTCSSLKRLRLLCSMFTGTNNFHNYTIGRQYHDPSTKRFIKSFEVDDPFIMSGGTGTFSRSLEWIKFRVHGQSFMLHQIRKFIGMIILLMKTNAPANIISLTLSEAKMNVPRAPGFGLLLDEPCFTAYNKRFADRVPLDATQYKTEIETFKREQIYPEIFENEFGDGKMFQWWTGLTQHAYDFRYVKDVV